MDYMRIYDIIYALAANEGREARLFGSCAPLAREAFARSLAGDYFPELWFELPLAGEPWFDLHALVEREDVAGQTDFDPATCGGCPEAFAWFAAQGDAARQLALSWDVGSGHMSSPAIQLLRRAPNTQLTCDFLAAAGRPDAIDAYRSFERRLPEDWFACYTGVFPTRTEPFLRVECIPSRGLQRAYASDPTLLSAHLRQAGIDAPGSTTVERCQALAATPFQLEFQFDVTPEGAAGRTFGASVRFSAPTKDAGATSFVGAVGLMQQVEAWGLADGRWPLLARTAYSKQLEYGGESCQIYCYPAFVKLRWRDGEPLDAKTYLMASTLRNAQA